MPLPNLSHLPPLAEWSFEAIGTQWVVSSNLALSASHQAMVLGLVEEVDQKWSRFRADSLVTGISKIRQSDIATEDHLPYSQELPHSTSPTPVAEIHLSAAERELFLLYEKLYNLTAGAMSPLVGQRLADLGYDAEYSFLPKDGAAVDETAVPRWEDSLYLQHDSLLITQPVLLDIGAIGKGWLVDRVFELLKDRLNFNNSDSLIVEAGGDIRFEVPQSRPLRIALEHPCDVNLAIGVAQFSAGAICASAVNRRRWHEGLHHVLDARLGVPVTEVEASWVIAERAALADGLATALFFSSPEQLAAVTDFSYVRIEEHLSYSGNFPGEIFR